MPSIIVGDLVILKEGKAPRNKWPLGKIIDVMPSDDNVTSVLKVRTEHKEHVRPAIKIYPFERLIDEVTQGPGAGEGLVMLQITIEI